MVIQDEEYAGNLPTVLVVTVDEHPKSVAIRWNNANRCDARIRFKERFGCVGVPVSGDRP